MPGRSLGGGKSKFNKDLSAARSLTDINRITIVKKFASGSVDYELMTDTDIRSALETFFESSTIDSGLEMTVDVFVDSPTQIKINNQGFYNDFLEDKIFSFTDNTSSIKIKDTSITGTICISLNQSGDA